MSLVGWRCWSALGVSVRMVDVDADNVVIGYAPLIREYVYFLESKLNFHRNHPEFNGAPDTGQSNMGREAWFG